MVKVLRFFFVSTVIFAVLFFVFFNLYLKAAVNENKNIIVASQQKIQELEEKNLELLQNLKQKDTELETLKQRYEKRISELTQIIKNKEDEINQLNSTVENLKRKISESSESNDSQNNAYINLILGDIELSKGNFVKSAELFEKVDLKSLSLGGLESYYQKRKEYSFEKAGRELYLKGLEASKSQKYQDAIRYFLESSKYSSKDIYYFDDLLYYLGLAYLRINNTMESLRTFERLLHTYQYSDYIDETILKVAQIYEQLEDFENALFYYKLLKSYGYQDVADKKIKEIEAKLKR
ncbi:MAG: Outer rane lipoprotein [Thermotogaceae bacterium]|jgi:tetratricopeptide (TPR) repeat protein|nr:Outer rane lipoprotein [Thermotogaceae bacterium]